MKTAGRGTEWGPYIPNAWREGPVGAVISLIVFALQDGLYKGNGIPAANKYLPVEVHFPGWKDHSNGQKRGDEALPYQEIYEKSLP